MGGRVHALAYRDCEWYWGARHAAIGHRGQNIDSGPACEGASSGPSLERMSEIADRGVAKRVRRIEVVLAKLSRDEAQTLELAFEPFGVDDTWITLRSAVSRHGLNLLRVLERLPRSHDAFRAAHKMSEGDPTPSMTREWLAESLRSYYKNHTGELPSTHVIAQLADAAGDAVAAALTSYDEHIDESTRDRLRGAA